MAVFGAPTMIGMLVGLVYSIRFRAELDEARTLARAMCRELDDARYELQRVQDTLDAAERDDPPTTELPALRPPHATRPGGTGCGRAGSDMLPDYGPQVCAPGGAGSAGTGARVPCARGAGWESFDREAFAQGASVRGPNQPPPEPRGPNPPPEPAPPPPTEPFGPPPVPPPPGIAPYYRLRWRWGWKRT